MSKLIILVVVVLGVLAIAQLVRLYELSAKLRNTREEDIPNRENKLNANLFLAFMLFLFGGFIWLMSTYGWTGRGEAASIQGIETDELLNLNFIIIIVVFFLTNFLLFFFAWKYVRKPGVKAYYFPHDNKLELLWTIVPAVVLAVIIILGLRTWNDLTDEAKPEAVRLELFSKQFDWTVRYAGDDNQLGLFDYKLTEETNNPLALMTTATIQNAIDSMENGASGIKSLEKLLNDKTTMLVPEDRDLKTTDLDRKERLIRLLYQLKKQHKSNLDTRAFDDIVFNANDTLYLCEGQEYEFNFRAKDVIHSAYFPHFRAQMNTVPGQTTRFNFTPNITTAEMRKRMNNDKFNFVLMCNKICGGSHYKMKLMVVVLPKAEYTRWYKLVSGKGTTEDEKGKSKLFKDIYAVGKPKAEAPTSAPVDGAVDSTAVAAAPGTVVDPMEPVKK